MSVDLTMFSAPAFLGIGKNTTPNLSRVTRHQPTQRHQESAIESRSTHSARNDCFFDDDASVIFGHHDKSSASDQMMGGATIVPTSSGESSPKRCGQANGRSNSGRAHVRRGKWLPEEQAYAEQIIHDFEAGLLPLRNGATLRAYLSGKLQCDPMRISKKFAGASSLGKQVFHKSARLSPTLGSLPTPEKEVEVRLQFLEKAFWRSVENRKSVRPRNRGPSSSAAAGSAGALPGQGTSKSRGSARGQARSVSGTSSSGGVSSGDEQQQQQERPWLIGNSFSSESSGFHSAWTTCDGGSDEDEVGSDGSIDGMVGGFGDIASNASSATPIAAGAKPPVTIVWKGKYGNDKSGTHTGKRKSFLEEEEEEKDGGHGGGRDSGRFDADVEDASTDEVNGEEEDNMWLDEAADLAGVLLSGDNDQDDDDDLWGHDSAGPAIIPSQQRHQRPTPFSLLEPRMKLARSRAGSFGEIIATSMVGAGAAFDAWPLKPAWGLRDGTSLMGGSQLPLHSTPVGAAAVAATSTTLPSASAAATSAAVGSAVKIPADEATPVEENHELGSFFISGMHSTDLGEFLPDECASEC